MGCRNQTCRLTNTAIAEGDKCVIIVLNDGRSEYFYNLMHNVYIQTLRKKDPEYIDHLYTLTEREQCLMGEWHTSIGFFFFF